MLKIQRLPLVLLFAVISLGLYANANGQQNADAPQGSVDVRIYLISSDSPGPGTPVPAELRAVANELAKTSGESVRPSVAASFMARAAPGSSVEGRGFLQLLETAPVSSLDWRIGKLTAEGTGTAAVRYILQSSRFSLRIPISLAKQGNDEGDAAFVFDAASFSSTRSELRAGVPAVMGSILLARPKRNLHVVAIVSPLN